MFKVLCGNIEFELVIWVSYEVEDFEPPLRAELHFRDSSQPDENYRKVVKLSDLPYQFVKAAELVLDRVKNGESFEVVNQMFSGTFQHLRDDYLYKLRFRLEEFKSFHPNQPFIRSLEGEVIFKEEELRGIVKALLDHMSI